jgi:hypothetical protein
MGVVAVQSLVQWRVLEFVVLNLGGPDKAELIK